jgi:hypothetical protein
MDVRLYQLWMHTIRTVRSNAVKWQVVHRESGSWASLQEVWQPQGMHFDFGNPDAVDIVDRASC